MLCKERGVVDLESLVYDTEKSVQKTYMLASNYQWHLNCAPLLQGRNCVLKLLSVHRTFGIVLLWSFVSTGSTYWPERSLHLAHC